MKAFRLGLALVLVVLSGAVLHGAGQTDEKDYQKVEGLKNWNQTLDLTSKKPGQYNLIIRARDESGNVAFEGPFNIFVDPESDLPIPAFNNPVPFMRVGGTLNIVGTCVDDDGVAKVEIRVDQGEWITAKGTEFWSYVLDGKDYPDGFHTLTARATDVNGLVGKEVQTSFNLDKLKPRNLVSSHEQGVLVSGTLKLEGSIQDENGISRFFVSKDSGKSYENLSFSYEEKSAIFRFGIDIDTRKLPDGPNVWWFKSVDKTGSVGYAAFLFFVDNSQPIIEFLKPVAGTKVQGRTHIVGRAYDPVGVASLSYTLGKETLPVPLVPGDPFFSVFADLPVTGDFASLFFTITDTTGNKKDYPLKLPLDPAADLPVLDLRYPVQGSIVRSGDAGGLSMAGFISDDDGVAALWYSLDGAKDLRVESKESFRIGLEGLSPGAHTLVVYGEDVFGAKGKPVSVKFTSVDGAAAIQLESVSMGDSSRPFVPGFELRRDQKNSLNGSFSLTNGLASASIQFGTQGKALPLVPGKASQVGVFPFTAEVPPGISYGVVPVTIRIEDVYKQTQLLQTYVYVSNYTVINDDFGIYLADDRMDASGQVQLTQDRPFSAVIVGGTIESAVLEPGSPLVKVSIDGSRVLVSAVAEGRTAVQKLKVTSSRKHVFESQPLVFVTDQESPVLVLTEPAQGFETREGVKLSGKAADGNKIKSVDYSEDEGITWTSLPLVRSKGPLLAGVTDGPDAELASFDASIKLTGLDGRRLLLVRAVDGSGNSSMFRIPGIKDTLAPELRFLAPGLERNLLRFGILGASVKDDANLALVEYTLDGKAWTPLPLGPYVAVPVDFATAVNGKVAIRAVDKSSNTSTLAWSGGFDPAKLAEQGTRVDWSADRRFLEHSQGESALGGATVGNSVSLVLTDKVPGGKAQITGGVLVLPEPDPELPKGGILFPLDGGTYRGKITVAGYAMNKLSVDPKAKPQPMTVEYVVDGGATESVPIGELWSFVLDTSTLVDGKHILNIRIIAADGSAGPSASLSFTVDQNISDKTLASAGPILLGSTKLVPDFSDPGTPLTWSFSQDGKTSRELKNGIGIDILPVPGSSVSWLLGREPKTGKLSRVFPLALVGAQPPVLAITHPLPGQVINGSVQVSGTIQSQLTLKSLKIENSAKEVLDLAQIYPAMGAFTGNLGLKSAKDGTILVTAEDVLGQKTSVSVKANLIAKSDEPLVELFGFDPAQLVTRGAELAGFARDDDQIASVRWSVDKGDVQSIQTDGPFRIKFDQAPGRHSMSIRAVDSGGLEGPALQINYIIKDEAPRISVSGFTDQTGQLAPVLGALVGEVKPGMAGLVETGNGLGKLEISFGSDAYMPLVAKQDGKDAPRWTFTYALPSSLPYGRVDYRLKVTDGLGLENTMAGFFYKVDKSGTDSIVDDEGIYLQDERIKDGGQVFLRSKQTIQGYFNGRPLKSIALSPPVPQANVSYEGSAIRLVSGEDGISPQTRLKAVTIDGDEFVFPQPLVFHVDGFAPEGIVDAPSSSQWLGNTVLVRLGLKENVGIKSIEYLFDNDEQVRTLAVKKGMLPAGAKVMTGLELWNFASRPAPELKAPEPVPAPASTANPATTTPAKPAATTPAKPAVTPAKPAATTPAKPAVTPAKPATTTPAKPATTTPSNTTKKPGGQSPLVGSGSGEQSASADTLNPVPRNLLDFHVEESLDITDLAEGPHILMVRITDTSDNIRYLYLPFRKDSTAPEISFVSPRPDDKVNGLITVTATALDSGEIADLAYTTDGKTFLPLDSALDIVQAFDLSKFAKVPETFTYRVADKAGNTKDFTAPINFDPEADKPVVQIQLPQEMEVIYRDGVMRQDFVVSGMAFDDDKIDRIMYRLDPKPSTDPKVPEDPWIELEQGVNNFYIPLRIDTLTDNEHVVEVKAIDIYGVSSDVQSRKFYVSLEEPVASLVSPTIDVTNRGTVTLKGTASDANGIKEVWVSMDNGNSFGRALGTENWTYEFDSRLYQDNTYGVQVRVIDRYETEGLFASLINIDNTGPLVSLDKPASGDEVNGRLILDGRARDNILMTRLDYVIYRLDASKKPVAEVSRKSLDVKGVFVEDIDISGLEAGWYNVRVEATDKANNQGFDDANFQILSEAVADRIDILYPLNGEVIRGFFNLEGRVISKNVVETVNIVANGQVIEEVKVNKRGYFKSSEPMGPGKFVNGEYKLQVKIGPVSGPGLQSAERNIAYAEEGPWIVVNDRVSGDFIRNRPFLTGKTGWNAWPLGEEQKVALEKDPLARRERELELEGRKLDRVEISFDNGKIFYPAQLDQGSWKFRIESLEMPDGPIFVIARTTYRNGESTVVRQVLTLDQNAPEISLISPEEGGRFNEKLVLKGIASDNYALEEVMVNIRTGDKSGYEVPGFIQGLYLDGHVLGSTNWEAGLGLTFFDDNVRLQAFIGQAPPGRFEGGVFGAKLLANVAKIPFQSFLGPDFSWLSTSLAIGAKFTYFTMDSELGFKTSDAGVMLGGVVVHWDILRMTYDAPVFNSLTTYIEPEIWMISSDVEAGFLTKLSFGISMDIL